MSDIRYPNIQVKLEGRNGNVFNLMGICVQAMKKAGLSSETVTEFTDDITSSGSYAEAVDKMMQWFDVS